MISSELTELICSTMKETSDSSRTHTISHDPSTSLIISSNKHFDFWSGYCNLVNTGVPVCLSECPSDFMPIVIELNLRFSATDVSSEQKPYSDKFLPLLVGIGQRIIEAHFRISSSNCQMELMTVILESTSMAEVDGHPYLTVNIRLQFPYARVDKRVQEALIRPEFIKLVSERNGMAELTVQPIGDWNDIVPISIDTIPMYGSSKLELIHIWSDLSFLEREISVEDAFVLENHRHVQHRLIDPELFSDRFSRKWLPLFLSMDYWTVSLELMNPTPSS